MAPSLGAHGVAAGLLGAPIVACPRGGDRVDEAPRAPAEGGEGAREAEEALKWSIIRGGERVQQLYGLHGGLWRDHIWR